MNDDQHRSGPSTPEHPDAVVSVTHAEWDNLPGESAWKDEMLRSGRVVIRDH